MFWARISEADAKTANIAATRLAALNAVTTASPPVKSLAEMGDVQLENISDSSATRASAANATQVLPHVLLVEATGQGRPNAALHIIAGQLSEGQIRALRDTFTAMDENNDGLLSVAELQEGLRRAGLGDVQDMPQIMEAIDADADGQIAYTEFLAATLQRKMYLQEDVCWTAFGVFDIDGDGRISPEELRQVLRSGSVDEMLAAQDGDAIVEAVDRNGDGLIDFEEFMEMMRGSSRSTRSIFVPAAALQEE
ncbi:unnamed protein product [Prorocentrum cordatum]|uniref:EF-hand domain-containing protein n=1 Tax=Prorocentrum cordatum TaxID=2364126 RepID=A0ABN9TFP4_9DINO|nr:unnamed protein product [Polarella glacialis]